MKKILLFFASILLLIPSSLPGADPSRDVLLSSVYPKTITPNGDGWNDKVFFVLLTPPGTSVEGSVCDLNAGHVGTLQPAERFAGKENAWTWDGRDDMGKTVSGGIYIYKIQAGGKTFSGLVSVAR